MTNNNYNGWTNYETWNVALWIDNEQGSQEYWREVTREIRETASEASQVKDAIWSIEQAARFTLADQLEEEMRNGSPLASDASCYSDLLGSALDNVNWREIAGNWLENLGDDE